MTVKCTNINNPHAAFRWENGLLRLYPNPEIAQSWKDPIAALMDLLPIQHTGWYHQSTLKIVYFGMSQPPIC